MQRIRLLTIMAVADTVKANWPKDTLVERLASYMWLNGLIPPTALPRPRR